MVSWSGRRPDEAMFDLLGIRVTFRSYYVSEKDPSCLANMIQNELSNAGLDGLHLRLWLLSYIFVCTFLCGSIYFSLFL